jgi:hypothetical protein
MFSNTFPGKIISPVGLHRLYKKHRIKYKAIHVEKAMSTKQQANFEEHRTRIIDELAYC